MMGQSARTCELCGRPLRESWLNRMLGAPPTCPPPLFDSCWRLMRARLGLTPAEIWNAGWDASCDWHDSEFTSEGQSLVDASEEDARDRLNPYTSARSQKSQDV